MDDNNKKILWEASKSVLRLILLFVVSWFVSSTLVQLDLVPEYHNFKVWVFTYMIPVRTPLAFVLTNLGSFVDKLLHEAGKLHGKEGWLGTKGLTGF